MRPPTVRTVLAAVLMLFAAGSLEAQVPMAPPFMDASVDALHSPGQDVTISLLTMGRGPEIWELFGHSAIWIHDNVTRRDTVFNWGEFDSHQPNFILHFLKGLMLYRMGGEGLDQVLYEYRYFDRTVQSQQLDLTTAEKDSLLHLMQINAEPANVQYRYDYFRNNCATRPRDLLDQVTGGALRAASIHLPGKTYRWQALRLMQADEPTDVGVDIGLGEPADRPTTRWDDMFLPKELHDVVSTAQVRDSTGAPHPLVTRETVLFQSDRAAEPAAPPNFGFWLSSIGVLLAAVIVWLGFGAAAEGRGGRIAAATVMGVWSLIAGFLGVVLAILWLFTDHVFAHANENLLLFNPLWLVLVVLIPVYYATGRAARFTRTLALVLTAIAAVAVVAHVVTLSRQSNLAIIGLALPIALAVTAVLEFGPSPATIVDDPPRHP